MAKFRFSIFISLKSIFHINDFTLNIPSNISSISVELTSESWHDNPLLRCFKGILKVQPGIDGPESIWFGQRILPVIPSSFWIPISSSRNEHLVLFCLLFSLFLTDNLEFGLSVVWYDSFGEKLFIFLTTFRIKDFGWELLHKQNFLIKNFPLIILGSIEFQELYKIFKTESGRNFCSKNICYLIFKMLVFIMTILKDENVPNCLSYNSFWIFNFHFLVFFSLFPLEVITYILYGIYHICYAI